MEEWRGWDPRPIWDASTLSGQKCFYYLRIKTKTKTEIIKSNRTRFVPRAYSKRTIRTDPYLLITSPLSPHYFLSERKGRFRYIDIFIGAINAYHDRWFNFLIFFFKISLRLGQSNPSRVIHIADDGQPRGASLSLRNCLLTNLKIMSGAWDIIMLFLIFFFFFFFIFHFNFLPV